MRRYVIAGIAAIGCLLPAACDVAAASPAAYHNDWSGQGQQGGGRNNGGTKPTAANSTSANGGASGASGSAAPTNDQNSQGENGNEQGEDPTVAPTVEDDPAASVSATADANASVAATVAPAAGNKPNNGLDVLARDCSNSKLQAHTGFQIAPACISTAFGEVAAEGNDPTLLITDSPRFVRANAPFKISVSTRNLVRDRFLGAAAGGYYLESSVLNADGIQRGHFHTACRMLASARTAPEPAPVPAFFLATQDNGGGSTPDTVTVSVPGLPSRGIAQCAVWAGDGSHRIPMMQRANQTPAFDAVRIFVG
jgi:hypothetical protein